MPFTLSHTVAGYPFYKLTSKKLPLIPLALGCMSPDFSYFLEDLFLNVGPCHSIRASFTKCLPVTLFILFLFKIYQSKVIAFIPSDQGRRFFQEEMNSIQVHKILPILLAILLGAWTHIFWDSWTHRNGFFVLELPVLNTSFFGMELFRILQHLSSVFGLILISLKLMTMGGDPISSWRWRYWLTLMITAVGFAVFFHPTFPRRSFAFELISCSIAYSSLGFLLTVLVYQPAKKFHRLIDKLE